MGIVYSSGILLLYDQPVFFACLGAYAQAKPARTVYTEWHYIR